MVMVVVVVWMDCRPTRPGGEGIRGVLYEAAKRQETREIIISTRGVRGGDGLARQAVEVIELHRTIINRGRASQPASQPKIVSLLT